MPRRHQAGVSAVAIVIVLAVIVVIIVAITGSGVGPDGLTSHVEHYIAMLDNRGTAAPGAKASGRAVVVDSEMKRIDHLHDRLPSDIRAQKHSEAETVIVLVRSSTGSGAGMSVGLAPASLQQGSYSIAAFVFDRAGKHIASHSVNYSTSSTGTGEEAEAKAKADRDMLAWIEKQF
jgi:hypothetical protein